MPDWAAVASGVEDLPVPDAAVRAEGEFCSGPPTWICEGWRMNGGVSVTAVRSWYLGQVDPTSRWRETWEPCFDGRSDSAGTQADGQDSLLVQWSRNRSENLFVRASGKRGQPVEIVLGRSFDHEMPCQ